MTSLSTRSGPLEAIPPGPRPRELGSVPHVAVLLAILLLSPRLNLVTVGGSTVRVEDLVVVALIPACWRGVTAAGQRQPAVRRLVAVTVAVAAWYLASAAIGAMQGRVTPLSAILYSMRSLEYFVAFGAALDLLRRGPQGRAWCVRMLVVFTVANASLAVLQYTGVADWGFSKFAYTRGAGLTAGPYELGAALSVLALHWAQQRRWVLVAVAVSGVYVSQARISFIALAVGCLVLYLGRTRLERLRRTQAPLAGGVTVVVLLACAVLAGMGIVRPSAA